jgi:hypothetical protein
MSNQTEELRNAIFDITTKIAKLENEKRELRFKLRIAQREDAIFTAQIIAEKRAIREKEALRKKLLE